MARQFLFFVAVACMAMSMARAECNVTATTCGECGVSIGSSCGFCSKPLDGESFCVEATSDPLNKCGSGCDKSDCHWENCTLSVKMLMIIIPCVVITLLIIIGIWIWCCCCRKSKNRNIEVNSYEYKPNRKERMQDEMRDEMQTQRRAERSEKTRHIREKYGLDQDSDDDVALL